MLYPYDNEKPLKEVEKYELMNEVNEVEEEFDYFFEEQERKAFKDLIKHEND